MRLLAVTNIYPTHLLPSLGTFVKQQIESLQDIGIDIELLFLNRVQEGMRVYMTLGRKVGDVVRRFEPDIVHIMYGGVMADIITRTVVDRPTVVSLCGSDLLGEHLSGSIRKLIANYGVKASHRAAKRATAVVVKSKNLEIALPNDINRSKVKIIPNGVDLELFRPINPDMCRKRLGWSNDRLNILFPTNGGDPRKRLGLAEAAVEAIKKYGIPAEIHQLRGVTHKEVPIWLNASDVVLLTSLHEGSPNIVKEALACNVPIVSVDVGDVRERIQDIAGCYIATAEPDNLAVKLELVYSAKQRINARVKMTNLSTKEIAFRLRALYCEIL